MFYISHKKSVCGLGNSFRKWEGKSIGMDKSGLTLPNGQADLTNRQCRFVPKAVGSRRPTLKCLRDHPKCGEPCEIPKAEPRGSTRPFVQVVRAHNMGSTKQGVV